MTSFPFSLLVRVAYVGREDFVVGVDLSGRRVAQSRFDQIVQIGSTALSRRYYI